MRHRSKNKGINMLQRQAVGFISRNLAFVFSLSLGLKFKFPTHKFALFIFVLDILVTDFIIVTDFTHERLLQISIRNGSIVKVPINVQSPGMAVDKTAKFLYFTDINDKTIQVSTLFGKNTSTFYATGYIHFLLNFHQFAIYY